MKAFALTICIPAAIAASTIWRGYVLSKLWLWFAVPTFAAHPIGIAQSIGISMIVSFLTYQYDSYEDKTKSMTEKIAAAVAVAVFMPATSLLIGWIVKGFLP
jgi:putative flippase GtrA